jgi:hypothetical protein
VAAMSWDGVHDLVRRAQAGDQEAWRRLHALAQGFLAARARRLLGPERSGWSTDELVLSLVLGSFSSGKTKGGEA